MAPVVKRLQLDRIPANPCIRFQVWYAGSAARRHTTETRAKAVLEAIPAKLENLRVLEVGAGWGFLSFLLACNGANATASDLLVEDVTFGSKVRSLNGYDGAIHFCSADALALPFLDASFDATISMEMIEHIPSGPGKVCAEFARVTRPGGFVIISTPNPGGVAQVVKNTLKKSAALRRRYSFLDYEEWFLPEMEILSAAAEAQLKLVALRRTGLTIPFIPDWLFPLNLIAEKACSIAPPLLTTNIFVFRKAKPQQTSASTASES